MDDCDIQLHDRSIATAGLNKSPETGDSNQQQNDLDLLSSCSCSSDISPDEVADEFPQTLPGTSVSISGDQRFCSNEKCSNPIFSSTWETGCQMTGAGGTYQKQFSDVSLEVPRNAVEEGCTALVHAAVCTDIERIQKTMNLSDVDEVVSPMAEFTVCNTENFQFNQPVVVNLPHYLPENFDKAQVKVYHVSKDKEGNVMKTPVRLVGSLRRNDSGCFHEMPPDGVRENEETESDFSGNTQMMEQQREVQPFFTFSSGKVIEVHTSSFCGFVCVYCGTQQKSLQLYAVVKGTIEYPVTIVSVYIWDGRLKVKDFAKRANLDMTDVKDPYAIDLLDHVTDTKLYVRIRLQSSSGAFQLVKDEDGLALSPQIKCFDLPTQLCCGKCWRKGKMRPMQYKWLLQAREGQFLSGAVDLSHTHTSAPDPWTSDVTTKITNTTFTVRNQQDPLLDIRHFLVADIQHTSHAVPESSQNLDSFLDEVRTTSMQDEESRSIRSLSSLLSDLQVDPEMSSEGSTEMSSEGSTEPDFHYRVPGGAANQGEGASSGLRERDRMQPPLPNTPVCNLGPEKRQNGARPKTRENTSGNPEQLALTNSREDGMNSYCDCYCQCGVNEQSNRPDMSCSGSMGNRERVRESEHVDRRNGNTRSRDDHRNSKTRSRDDHRNSKTRSRDDHRNSKPRSRDDHRNGKTRSRDEHWNGNTGSRDEHRNAKTRSRGDHLTASVELREDYRRGYTESRHQRPTHPSAGTRSDYSDETETKRPSADKDGTLPKNVDTETGQAEDVQNGTLDYLDVENCSVSSSISSAGSDF